MHGATGGCDGEGRGSVKPQVFDFLLPLFCYTVYSLVNGTHEYFLVLISTYYIKYIISNST